MAGSLLSADLTDAIGLTGASPMHYVDCVRAGPDTARAGWR